MNISAALAAAAAGFAGLIFGADILVRGGAGAARTLGLSTMTIGLTVVAYGTSAPELAASLVAALAGHPAVTLGNVIGSNIANIGLILGTTALVVPLTVRLRSLQKEIPFMLAVTGLFLGMAVTGTIGRVEGFLLLAVLLAFNILSLRWSQKEPPVVVKEVAAFEWELSSPQPRTLARDLALASAGLVLLAAGGHYIVRGAVALAEMAGISETVIGLSLVAVGTSLPELATSLIAALRGESAISIGNLVGSNLFNILGAVGISAAFRPLQVSRELLFFEMPVLAVFTVCMALLLGRKRRVTRWDGFFLLAGYAIFMAAIFFRARG